jgi:putative glutamine amidotransferase
MCSSSVPLIGVTMRVEPKESRPNHYIASFYADSVVEAGGIPVYLPIVEDEAVIRGYVERVDGLLLTGDADIPPQAYGEEPVPQTKVMQPERYEFERRLIDIYLQTRKPVLGVCLGCQFVNVALGGTLIQDIPSMVETNVAHRREGGDAEHPVRIEPRSLLGDVLGMATAQIYSSHHQAVKQLGRNLRPVAWAEDGIVEALEPERPDGRWLLLVQWHPERMVGTEVRARLFRALVEASRSRRGG